MKIQGPIECSMQIGITDGKTSGFATVSLGRGQFPAEQEMRDTVNGLIASGEMPEGFRLMTKREWWGEICMQEFGVKAAMPGGEEFDEPSPPQPLVPLTEEQIKSAERWRRLMLAVTMPFPILAVSDDPENENRLMYNPDRICERVDGLDMDYINAHHGIGAAPGETE